MKRRINQRSYADNQKHRLQRKAQLVTIDRMLDKPRSHRTVVYLDTREALQTRALLDQGYSAANLLAVNFRAVELALLTRRLDSEGRPRVCTRAGEFEEVVWGLGAVDVLDFDGMSHCGGEVGDTLLTNSVYATTPKVLSFTILGGRENNRGKDLISAQAGGWNGESPRPFHTSANNPVVQRRHWSRVLSVLINVCGYGNPDLESSGMCLFHPTRFAWGRYISTAGQPMLWLMARLTPHAKDRKLRRFDRRLMRYGMIPICYGQGRNDAVGCPAWSAAQSGYMGMNHEAVLGQFKPEFRCHRGWPVRKLTQHAGAN